MRQILRYCRRNLFFAHLTDKVDRRDRWPDWTKPFEAVNRRGAADRPKPSVILGEIAQFLAITTAAYLLVIFVVGIL